MLFRLKCHLLSLTDEKTVERGTFRQCHHKVADLCVGWYRTGPYDELRNHSKREVKQQPTMRKPVAHKSKPY